MALQVHFSSERDNWGTPTWLIAELTGRGFDLTLDVCATPENAKAPFWITPECDALRYDWTAAFNFMTPNSRRAEAWAWMNPPYGRAIGKWVEKAVAEAEKGLKTLALVPARTDTRWFRRFLCQHENGRWTPRFPMEFFLGRLHFELDGIDQGAAPFPSVLVHIDINAGGQTCWRPSVCLQELKL